MKNKNLLSKTYLPGITFLFMVMALVSQSNAQNIPWVRPQIDTSYSKLAKDNLELRIQVQRLEEQTNRQFELLGNQINFASYSIGFFSIALAIGGVFLGFYVNIIWARIKKARKAQEQATKRSEAFVKESEHVKQQVEELSRSLQGNIETLYSRIKDQEDKHNRERERLLQLEALKKLSDNPREIPSMLFSTKLRDEDYPLVDKAFDTLKQQPLNSTRREDLVTQYVAVLYNSFPEKVIMDRSFRQELLYNVMRLRDKPHKKIQEIVELFDKIGWQEVVDDMRNFIIALRTSDEDIPYNGNYSTLIKCLATKDRAIAFYNHIKGAKHFEMCERLYLQDLTRMYDFEKYPDPLFNIFGLISDLQLQEEQNYKAYVEEAKRTGSSI